MTFIPRQWQIECAARETEQRQRGESKVFFLEACPGAGKSSMAAQMAKQWLQLGLVDHVIVVAPWKPIISSMVEAFQKQGIDTFSFLFSGGKGYQPPPKHEASVLTHKSGCSAKTVEAVKEWSRRHFWRVALIVDEVHHNSLGKSWGQYADLLGEHCERIVVMSGTPFRPDGMPITFAQYHQDNVQADYTLTYTDGVAAGYVRDVATRWIDGTATIRYRSSGDVVEKPYGDLTLDEIQRCQGELFDTRGEMVRSIIRAVHDDLVRTRRQPGYEDAAALFVCRPGKTAGEDDKHVHMVEQAIRQVTGCRPVVVTHHDAAAEGKIRQFRRSQAPYLVAVNMVSEGCDIPRIVSIGMLRLIHSPLLVRQIVGRAIRRRGPNDQIAANIYAPRLAPMAEELEKLYEEGRAGRKLALACEKCGQLPCVCVRVCKYCSAEPCTCPTCPDCNRRSWGCVCGAERVLDMIDAEAQYEGGRYVNLDVEEAYVQAAQKVAWENQAFRHMNTVQMGAFLQAAGAPVDAFREDASPEQDRRRLIDKLVRYNRRLSRLAYDGHEHLAWSQEVAQPWSVGGVDEVIERKSTAEVERMIEALRHRIEEEL